MSEAMCRPVWTTVVNQANSSAVVLNICASIPLSFGLVPAILACRRSCSQRRQSNYRSNLVFARPSDREPQRVYLAIERIAADVRRSTFRGAEPDLPH